MIGPEEALIIGIISGLAMGYPLGFFMARFIALQHGLANLKRDHETEKKQ